jgi:dTDP-4-dehydrorhamnose 3,5-epimerase
MHMKVRETGLVGVLVLTPIRVADSRGYFAETYNRQTFREAGITTAFLQDNQSLSLRAGTIRGLHFQRPPAAQAKLIRVVRGSIYDVAVDLRIGSPTYGQWTAERISAEGGEQIFVPQGFAHGFCTLEGGTEVCYKVDNYYNPAQESGVIWNDPTLCIPWPVVKGEEILSEKDGMLATFESFNSPFSYASVEAL